MLDDRVTKDAKHGGREVRCPWCNRMFRAVADFDQHCVTRHHDEYICRECGRRFASQGALGQHQADKMHGRQGNGEAQGEGKPSGTTIPSEFQKKKFTCLTCRETFFPLRPILQHQLAKGHVGIHPRPFPERERLRPLLPSHPGLSKRKQRSGERKVTEGDSGHLVIRNSRDEGRVVIRNLPPSKPPAIPAWVDRIDSPQKVEQMHGIPCPQCGRPSMTESLQMQGDEQVVVRRCRLCGNVERF
ncbi:MAG: hypothetical protein RBG13Loki_2745 [Promethearchaeota archaeon CR_4]|nr:MAG: hypothetical protein RBG13Loki_2745 [Candidatus Lokiarchaeota archaeon CR_4]